MLQMHLRLRNSLWLGARPSKVPPWFPRGARAARRRCSPEKEIYRFVAVELESRARLLGTLGDGRDCRASNVGVFVCRLPA